MRWVSKEIRMVLLKKNLKRVTMMISKRRNCSFLYELLRNDRKKFKVHWPLQFCWMAGMVYICISYSAPEIQIDIYFRHREHICRVIMLYLCRYMNLKVGHLYFEETGIITSSYWIILTEEETINFPYLAHILILAFLTIYLKVRPSSYHLLLRNALHSWWLSSTKALLLVHILFFLA